MRLCVLFPGSGRAKRGAGGQNEIFLFFFLLLYCAELACCLEPPPAPLSLTYSPQLIKQWSVEREKGAGGGFQCVYGGGEAGSHQISGSWMQPDPPPPLSFPPSFSPHPGCYIHTHTHAHVCMHASTQELIVARDALRPIRSIPRLLRCLFQCLEKINTWMKTRMPKSRQTHTSKTPPFLIPPLLLAHTHKHTAWWSLFCCDERSNELLAACVCMC